MKDKDLCLCCWEHAKYLSLFPEKPDTCLTETSLMWASTYKCEDCQNVCTGKDLLIDKSEFLNSKRTKLIDKMLNE